MHLLSGVTPNMVYHVNQNSKCKKVESDPVTYSASFDPCLFSVMYTKCSIKVCYGFAT